MDGEDEPLWLSGSSRPRILYVAQMPDYSGAEFVQVVVMRADPDPLLACPPRSRTAELAQSLDVATVPLPFRPLRHSGGALETLRSVRRGILSARDLRRILRAHPERRILHCAQIRPGLLASIASVGMRLRVVWNVTDFLPPPPLRQAIRLVARLGVAQVIAHSTGLANDFAGGSTALRRRTAVIFPAVETGKFGRSQPQPGRPRAALVGHVSPTKHTDLGIRVAARVAAEVPEFQLVIVGRAQYRDEDFAFERRLKKQVATDGALAKHVVFNGYSRDIPAELANAGLLLHCRDDEPFGLVVVEAMAAGLPVVAPAAAGPLEIVEHGVTGFLYQPRDDEDAARYVLRLIRNREEAEAMGRAAKASAARRFSASRQLAATDRLLAQLT